MKSSKLIPVVGAVALVVFCSGCKGRNPSTDPVPDGMPGRPSPGSTPPAQTPGPGNPGGGSNNATGPNG